MITSSESENEMLSGVGAVIREWRIKKNMTQQDLAKAVGVHDRTVATWESPLEYWGTYPSSKKRQKIAEVLGIDPVLLKADPDSLWQLQQIRQAKHKAKVKKDVD